MDKWKIVYEFDKKNIHLRQMSLDEALTFYPDDAMQQLHHDGSAAVNKHIEIFFEGCYHPSILLTLE